MAERQILQYTVNIRRVHLFGGAKMAPALRAFGLLQVTLARQHAHYFPGAGYLESFGHRLLRFYTFGSSHNSLFSKRTATIRRPPFPRKRFFGPIFWADFLGRFCPGKMSRPVFRWRGAGKNIMLDAL
jgi:hypothetical protein